MLTNKTIFENIYKFDDCHIRICVHYDESLDLFSLVVIVAQHNGSFNSFLWSRKRKADLVFFYKRRTRSLQQRMNGEMNGVLR